MLSTKTLKAISLFMKMSEEDLKAAIVAEDEKDLDVPEGTVFSKAELDTRDKAVQSAAYSEGKAVGVEMFVKEQKKKLNLEFEGKDGDSLITALKEKAAAGEDKDAVEKLRKSVEAAERKAEEAESALKSHKLHGRILSEMPDKLKYKDKEEALAIFRLKGYEVEEKDGTLIAKLHGAVVKDEKMQTELPAKDVLEKFFKDREEIEVEPGSRKGRGGGSSKPEGLPGKLSDLEKSYAEEHGQESLNSSAFQAAVQEAMKADANFDLNA